jgi:dethiobiotin synthetase
MSGQRIIVSGTDTGIGKTVIAAALTAALDASYWKPVQAGLDEDGGTDSKTVARLAGIADGRILAEAHRLATPCSPHRAAEIDGVTIDPGALDLPAFSGPLVIEGAGGVLVPLTRSVTYADVFARWGQPVVLVASTRIGTINHSLLSIEALRNRGAPILGIAFSGEANDDSESTIAAMGGVKRLGRLPRLEPLNRETLADAFAANFDLADFAP